MWLKPLTRLQPYLGGDQLHTAFNFDFLDSPWDAGALRQVIENTLGSIGAAAPWVLSNHDVTRHLTRYGRADAGSGWRADPAPADLALGTRRARAAILLSLALPGSCYLYQGEELGLFEVEDIPEALIADPIYERTGHALRGRDGCRVPLPWQPDAPGFGFGPAGGAVPWLPQPGSWRQLAAAAQAGDPSSMLALYRTALRLRAAREHLDDDALVWITAPEGVLAFRRPGGFACVVNLSAGPVPLPADLGPGSDVHAHTATRTDAGPDPEVLLASSPLDDGKLPPDTTVWLRTGADFGDTRQPTSAW